MNNTLQPITFTDKQGDHVATLDREAKMLYVHVAIDKVVNIYIPNITSFDAWAIIKDAIKEHELNSKRPPADAVCVDCDTLIYGNQEFNAWVDEDVASGVAYVHMICPPKHPICVRGCCDDQDEE